MTVTDADKERAGQLVLADVLATIGPGHEALIRESAERLRECNDQLEDYFDRVVEDTQQISHDSFIDTDWPRCPLHGRHPLWLGEGGWWCMNEGVFIAPVGQLDSTPPPPPSK